MIYFTADTHFGHKNIMKYDQRPFNTISEMDETMALRWNQTVEEDDTIYILGDFSFYESNKTNNILSKLKGKKILIRGNHDHGIKKLEFDAVYDYREIKHNGIKFVLSHYPLHFYNAHRHNAIQLYGHVHNSGEWNDVNKMQQILNEKGYNLKMYNVGCMLHDYKPISIGQIERFFNVI